MQSSICCIGAFVFLSITACSPKPRTAFKIEEIDTQHPPAWQDLSAYREVMHPYLNLDLVLSGSHSQRLAELSKFCSELNKQNDVETYNRKGAALVANILSGLQITVLADNCPLSEREWFCHVVSAVFAAHCASPKDEAPATVMYLLVSDLLPAWFQGGKQGGSTSDPEEIWTKSELYQYLKGAGKAYSPCLVGRILTANEIRRGKGK